jgi:hypothetical protein
MLRSFGAVVAGCFAAGMIIGMVQQLGHNFFPPPKAVQEALASQDDAVRMKAIKEYLPNAPVEALLFVPLAYAVGSFGGGALVAWIARRRQLLHALIVGGLMMGGGVMMLLSLPHPPWLAALCLAAFLPAAWAGAKLATPKPETAAPAEEASGE